MDKPFSEVLRSRCNPDDSYIGFIGPDDCDVIAVLEQQIASLQQRVEALERALQATPAVIPTNWLDPLLTGPRKVVVGGIDAPSIERLLLALKKALEQHVTDTLAAAQDNARLAETGHAQD